MIWAVCLVGRTGYRMIDEILIKKLVPELIEDYFDFFDNRAFSDGSPYYPCYCNAFNLILDRFSA